MLFPGHVSPQGSHAGSYDPSTSVGRKFVRALIVLIVLLLLSYPLLETFMLTQDERVIAAQDLPAGIGQLRIVYVSDIHKGGLFTDARVADLVSRINACNADLVLLGGDYAADSTGAIAFFRSMPRIHARYGVYGVLGNHDRTIPETNLTTLRGVMQSAGVTPLINDVSRLRIGNHDIFIAGIDDVHNGRPKLEEVAARVHAEDFVIFLCHSPAVIPQAMAVKDFNGKSNWFDLGLFGHTHGGQIAFIGPMLKDDGVPDQYTRGWFRQGRTDMLVSRGVGTSGLPVRLFCTPQIHLITVNTAR